MRTKLLFTILATTMLIATALQSAEIIPIWNKESGAGDIQDMEILPGGDQFLMLSGIAEGSRFQFRNTIDGELVREVPGFYASFANFELTPDSNRIVVTSGKGGDLELRNLQTFHLIKGKFVSRPDGFTAYIKNIAIDPKRPYVYVTQYGNNGNSSNYQVKSKISVYNYETMELVKDLTDYDGYEYTAIAVSDDGKYLATLNDGKAYLKVWDLETMELIRDVQLYDDKLPNTDWWCDSKDIQFSKLNSDVIYYSGLFTKQINEKRINGIFKFKITSSTKSRIVENGLYDGGLIIPFENENRFLISRPFSLYVLNILTQEVEYNIKSSDSILGSNTLLYTFIDNAFIGTSTERFAKFRYDSQTEITANYEEEIIISPNPTSNFVNINMNCTEPIVSYQINDINGLIIFQSSIQNQVGNLQIDFSSYPSGVYFLSVMCNNHPKTYKIIKEG